VPHRYARAHHDWVTSKSKMSVPEPSSLSACISYFAIIEAGSWTFTPKNLVDRSLGRLAEAEAAAFVQLGTCSTWPLIKPGMPAMNKPRPPDDEPIEPQFRNGSVTVVGIIAAFSLGFLTQWAGNPIPWQHDHLAAVVPIIIGIALQLKALADLLSLASVHRRIYERSMRWFMVGLVLTALGVVLAMFFDLTSISGSRLVYPEFSLFAHRNNGAVTTSCLVAGKVRF
jgi:hypothetical protein